MREVPEGLRFEVKSDFRWLSLPGVYNSGMSGL